MTLRRGPLAVVGLAVCATALAVAARGAALPSFAGCTASQPVVRPSSIVVACGDGNFFLSDITWSRWTSTSAAGRGTGHQNDCKPYCAAGHFHTYAVSIRLSRPETCRHGRREFTRFTYRFVSRKPAGVPRGETMHSPFYRGSGCP